MRTLGTPRFRAHPDVLATLLDVVKEPGMARGALHALRVVGTGDTAAALERKRPQRANRVRVHEVFHSGAIAKVIAIDESGREHTLWQGEDPTRTPGVFDVRFPLTSYRVHAVHLVLDTNRVIGWNEIDAVELVGPDGRQWTASASASSTYGQTSSLTKRR